ncbi:MAG: hypothetical protein PF495_13925 [Spirochaetales bacterium]|jgi:hypothetical protein|nr:hypothetical protein [Spirochaetales bacterium]
MICHVTDLDSMIWYRRIEGMTVDDMRGRLLRTAEPNDQMRTGTAWHAILENPPAEIETIMRGGFTFRVDCDAELTVPQIREIRASKTYHVDGVDVRLTGGCDGISGNVVTDHKLTFKPKPENYFGSYQWRAYLDIYEADIFEYVIYSAKHDRKTGEVVIHDISTMRMYRYPEMISDIMGGILDLVRFFKEHVPEKCDK